MRLAYIHLRVGHLMPTLMSIRHHLYANRLVCSSTHKVISMIVRLSRALLLVRLVLRLFVCCCGAARTGLLEHLQVPQVLRVTCRILRVLVILLAGTYKGLQLVAFELDIRPERGEESERRGVRDMRGVWRGVEET